MLQKLALLSIVLSGLLGVQSAQAGCDGCFVKNSMILFPHDVENSKDEIYLAWNFKNVAGVDYERMLTDAAYSQSVFERDSNDQKVTNYFTDAEGKVLAEIPDSNPEQPYGGIFGAAGLSPNHRGSQSVEDSTLRFAYFSMDTRWYTSLIKLYRKNITKGSLTLSEVKGINVKKILGLYKKHLDRRFAKIPSYQRDRKSLAISFTMVKANATGCKAQGMDICFTLEALAYVPKEPLADNFSNTSKIDVGIRLNLQNQGNIKIFAVQTVQ